MLALLFFCAAVLFFPLKFTAGVTADFSEKTLSWKMKFYNFLPVADKNYALRGLSVECDGKKIALKKKKKLISVKKALKLTRLSVMLIFGFEAAGFSVYPFAAVAESMQNARKDKCRLYFRNAPQHKIIAAEGIIYTCLANIIFEIIKSLGVSLWNLLKTKSKK